MNYTDDNRGTIQYRDFARRIVDFHGLKWGNITPTDVDGFIEFHNKAFILFEFKHVNGEFNRDGGQAKALTRACDSFQSAGKEAVLLICRHDAKGDIIAANTLVELVYYKGRWYQWQRETLRKVMEKIYKWLSATS